MEADRRNEDKSFRIPTDENLVRTFREQALAPARHQNADVPAVLRFAFHFLCLFFCRILFSRVRLYNNIHCVYETNQLFASYNLFCKNRLTWVIDETASASEGTTTIVSTDRKLSASLGCFPNHRIVYTLTSAFGFLSPISAPARTQWTHCISHATLWQASGCLWPVVVLERSGIFLLGVPLVDGAVDKMRSCNARVQAVKLPCVTATLILLGEIAQFLGPVMPPMPEFQRKLCA